MTPYPQISPSLIKAAASKHESDVAEFLCRLISYPSTLGREREALEFLEEAMERTAAEVARVPIIDRLAEDPDYTCPDADGGEAIDYRDKYNLVVDKKGRGTGGRSVIVAAHVDVVDAEPDWRDAFRGVVRDGKVFGRGACDDKGQVAAVLLAFELLEELGINLCGDLSAQLVIEEEIGGNGALSLIKQGHKADGVVVLEPTALNIHPANRGALWFRVTTTGRSLHMGRCHEGVNSIEKMMEVVRLLREYEKRLLAESRGYRLFERYDRPVQLNVGTIHGGVLPSMVPSKTVLEGGVGFLPNKNIEQIKKELDEAVRRSDDDWLREHFRFDYSKVHNDAYEISADHPLVGCLAQGCNAVGLGSEVFGWNVSCDAHLYAKRGKMPTVVFGAGDITQAHSTDEYIEIRQIIDAAAALVVFLMDWCGHEGAPDLR